MNSTKGLKVFQTSDSLSKTGTSRFNPGNGKLCDQISSSLVLKRATTPGQQQPFLGHIKKTQKEGSSGSRKEKNNALVDKVRTVVHRACFIPSL